MTIQELYDKELAYWTQENQNYFGVSPIHEDDAWETIQQKINDDCEKFWNSKDKCVLARALAESSKFNKDYHLQKPNSYKLVLNFQNMCVDILASYVGFNAPRKVATIPTPCDDLSWIMNKSHYVLRAKATKHGSFFVKRDRNDMEIVIGEGWTYNTRTQEFECTSPYPFDTSVDYIFNNRLSTRSKYILENSLRPQQRPLTVNNFKDALSRLPSFTPESIFNYTFTRFDEFTQAVEECKKQAHPIHTPEYVLPINLVFQQKQHIFDSKGTRFDGCLVRSESPLFALENFRTCTNIYDHIDKSKKKEGFETRPTVERLQSKKERRKENQRKHKPAFTYDDANGFFDCFKTVTSKEAGRQRLLLDNIIVHDGMLWVIDENGKEHNMYEYMTTPQDVSLSCISESLFCNNDKPKRIMMTGKMNAQSVPLAEEVDHFTHRIKARVGFTDLEGFTSADSIVISESFAKRLITHETHILHLNRKSKIFTALNKFYLKNKNVDVETMSTLVFPSKNKAILLGRKNVKVDRVDDVDVNNVRVFLSWDVPFRLGDKITNLHGAKGTVGLILPDSKMPKLLNKVGNMEPGPLEVVISGFSTMRRGSLGQIFEAWALASGIEFKHGEDFISKATEKYGEQMKEYSKNSVVRYNGIKNVIPVGINYIMRLYHHATTKVCLSEAKFGYTRNLRFGEMEKYNLVANDCPNILRELGIRSITKYVGSHGLVTQMETTRELPKQTKMTLQFIEILKSIGYSLTIEGDDNYQVQLSSVDKQHEDCQLNNQTISGDDLDEDNN